MLSILRKLLITIAVLLPVVAITDLAIRSSFAPVGFFLADITKLLEVLALSFLSLFAANSISPFGKHK